MKTRFTSLILALFIALLLSSNSFALPVELIENGGFETGSLSGWDYSWNVIVQSDNYNTGNYAAGLSISDTQSQNNCWNIGNDTNPYSAFLAQELNGFSNTDKKLTVSFSYNVSMLKNQSSGDDHLYAGLVGCSGSIYAQCLLATSYTTGWVTSTQYFDLSGLNLDRISLVFFFLDSPGLFGSYDVSSAFLDDVSVKANPVPEPSTILLLGLGLIGLSLFGRKRES